MATAGLSTLGVKLYQALATNGTKPTTGYTQLTRVNSIGEASVTPENIDASALEDLTTKYIAGRSSVSDTFEVTINLTDETEVEWEEILGKQVCFMVTVPNFTKAFFVIATVPSVLPMPAVDQNGLLTMAIGCTVNEFIGLDEAVTVA